MTLIEYIEQSVERTTPEFKDDLSKKIKTEKHQKGTVLLKEGELCRKLYYVEKGCLRFFYYDDEGKDITHWFIFEGEFITETDSLFQQKPSEFYIETLEDCTLQTFGLTDFVLLIDQYKSMTSFGFSVMIRSIINLGEKIKDLQFRDAKTRYDNLIEKHYDILLRVPLGHIVSYLGITQQSLSRIRRQK